MAVKIINSALVRKLNLARVFHAIREKPGVSQGALREITQVDRATISSIVLQLEADGLIERSKGALSKGSGRPEDALQVKSDTGLLIGVAVKAQEVRLVGATLDGTPRSTLQVHASTNAAEAIQQLRGAIALLVSQCELTALDVRGVGIALQGTIDRGGQKWSSRQVWRDNEFRELIESDLPCGVQVESDVNAAALAEHRFGAARGLDDFLMIHSQAGISGSFYLRNRLYRSGSGLAGEIGHMKVEPKGRLCSCGARGCLQAYVSEAALLDRFAEFDRHIRTLQEADAAARGGDSLIRTVLFEAGSYLGTAIANVVNTLGLTRIFLGGDFVGLGPHMMQAITQALHTNALSIIQPGIAVSLSSLGEDAVAMGGVALAMETFLPLTHEIA